MAAIRHDDTERDRIERSLDKAFEQEPRRQHNYFRSRERLALKLAMVGTDEEARIARGFIVPHAELAAGADRVTVNADAEDLDFYDEPKPDVVQPEPAWRPADGGES
jgi:hypothetical protein